MRNSLIGFLMIVLAIFFTSSVLVPKIREVHDITVDRDAYKMLKDVKEQRLAALTQLESTFASRQNDINAILSTLPQDPQIPDILVSVEEMGRVSGINITSITPQVLDSLNEVSVSVAGSGTLDQIQAFLVDASSNNRPMSISTSTIAKSDNTINFNITITLPYLGKAQPNGGTTTSSLDVSRVKGVA